MPSSDIDAPLSSMEEHTDDHPLPPLPVDDDDDGDVASSSRPSAVDERERLKNEEEVRRASEILASAWAPIGSAGSGTVSREGSLRSESEEIKSPVAASDVLKATPAAGQHRKPRRSASGRALPPPPPGSSTSPTRVDQSPSKPPATKPTAKTGSETHMDEEDTDTFI